MESKRRHSLTKIFLRILSYFIQFLSRTSTDRCFLIFSFMRPLIICFRDIREADKRKTVYIRLYLEHDCDINSLTKTFQRYISLCSFHVLHDRFSIQTELIQGNWISTSTYMLPALCLSIEQTYIPSFLFVDSWPCMYPVENRHYYISDIISISNLQQRQFICVLFFRSNNKT